MPRDMSRNPRVGDRLVGDVCTVEVIRVDDSPALGTPITVWIAPLGSDGKPRMDLSDCCVGLWRWRERCEYNVSRGYMLAPLEG